MTTTTATSPFVSIEEALHDVRSGRMVVVVDDEDRENEGDLTLAAEHVTPETINFMARHGRGLICAALTPERLDALRVPLMTADNTSNFGTAFCETVDARRGVTTGISAADRAISIQALVADATRPEDLARPGHVFPLRARPGGVLSRAGQTEAAVDLARLAGLRPAGVICEIMNEDGTMARVPQLSVFCRQHGLKMITVADLIRYRLLHERYVRRVAAMPDHPTRYGACDLWLYRSDLDRSEHMVMVFGAGRGQHAGGGEAVLVRVQHHCPFAALGSVACDCGRNLDAALRRIQAAGAGIAIVLYQNRPGFVLGSPPAAGGPPAPLRHPDLDGTGPGATASGPSAGSPEPGTSPEPGAGPQVQRETGIGAQILLDLGVRQLRVLTNHPRRLAGLEGYGLRVAGYVPLTAAS